MVTLSGLFGIALTLRCGVGKRLEFFRGRLRLEQAGKGRNVDAEAACIGQLRHQTEIGDRGGVTEAEGSGFANNELLACRKPLAVDPCRPARDLLLREAK